jgi:hypothetical protein
MKLRYSVSIFCFWGLYSGCVSTDLPVKSCDNRLQNFSGSFTLWAHDRSQYLSKMQSTQLGSRENFDMLAEEHVLNQRAESLEREARSLADSCPYEKRRSTAKHLRSHILQDYAMNRVLDVLSTE